MRNHGNSTLRRRIGRVITVAASCVLFASLVAGQETTRLTPVQREIERQRQRLASMEAEERRDALMRLENLKRPDASRAAAAALNDTSPTVRVAAARAVLSLPNQEAATLLLPLLKDKSDFVRREVAFALGEAGHPSAVSALADLLSRDKQPSVRAAAAIALGEIGDGAALPALSRIISGETSKKKKSKSDEEEFVVRSAVRSLGRIGSRAGVATLIAALQNESNLIDTRREAATALGLLGDAAALPALNAAFQANADPYLSEVARMAIREIRRKSSY